MVLYGTEIYTIGKLSVGKDWVINKLTKIYWIKENQRIEIYVKMQSPYWKCNEWRGKKKWEEDEELQLIMSFINENKKEIMEWKNENMPGIEWNKGARSGHRFGPRRHKYTNEIIQIFSE